MLKTSLFNKGIYKSTLSRFKWGVLLYFVLLFFSTSFVLLINDYDYLPEVIDSYTKSGAMILRNDFFIFPMLLASFVPTATAFLAFDMFSSKKHSVFLHSLPCKRVAIYNSVLLGSYTLMALPVILNGIILMLISIFKLGDYFTIYSCLKWIAANLIHLFVMFAVATFSAGITSSRISLIFINAVLNFIPLAIAFSISGIASEYLYGFDDNSLIILEETCKWIPALSHWFTTNAYSGFRRSSLIMNIFSYKTVIFSIVAIFLYVSGLILYKKRNVESAGNFVAFRVLNPILKYTLTILGTLFTFAVLYYSEFKRGFYMILLLLVVSLILYFATEMVLKKNLKVFKTYKGYLAFAVIIILFNYFMQYTGFFGYETRIPDADEIKSVSISYSRQSEYTESIDVIEETINIHKNITSSIPSVKLRDHLHSYPMNITYELKNGKMLKRRYSNLTQEEQDNILSALYEHKDYRIVSDDVRKINLDDLDYLRIQLQLSPDFNYSFSIEKKENISAFFEEWKKDTESLGYYEKLKTDNFFSVIPMYTEVFYSKPDSHRGEIARVYNTGFNANYKNTMSYFERNGYLNDIHNCKVFISKEPHFIEKIKDNSITKVYMNDKEDGLYKLSENQVSPVGEESSKALIKDILSGNIKNDDSDGNKYIIYIMSNATHAFEQYTKALIVSPENLPEYLK